MNTHFKSPFGTYCLQRYPIFKNQQLRAWDAADEYLLKELGEKKSVLKNKKCLIFNDAFGALSTALYSYNPTIVVDSYVSKLAIVQNFKDNDLDLSSINIFSSLDELAGNYDFVCIKMPKSMDYLRYFIHNLSTHINESSHIIIAGMVKAMPKTTWDLLEQSIGSTQTSLSVKKAKLITVKFENKYIKNEYPKFFIQEETNFKIYNHASVFSKKSLDIGTRFLLQNIPELDNIKSIIDLGCGNGVVGLNLMHKYPKSQVMFTDESTMAVESARLTVKNNNHDCDDHIFRVNNCLDNIEPNSTDFIVCNPPFHESHSIGIQIALKMFQQSYNTLKLKGYFLVVANRHLPYYAHLKRIFKRVINVSSNKKFTIYLMQK
jgi:16S rRNA (guanine1207-N2)-methyltransferase